MADKTGGKTGNTGRFKPGHDPRRGHGKKGRSGRPPNEFRDWCAMLLADPTAESEVLAVLKNSKHPAYASMWKAVTDRAYGKAPQALDVTSGGGKITLNLVPGDDD